VQRAQEILPIVMGNFNGSVLAENKGQKAKKLDFQALLITPFMIVISQPPGVHSVVSVDERNTLTLWLTAILEAPLQTKYPLRS
jgi:hypothetical protein